MATSPAPPPDSPAPSSTSPASSSTSPASSSTSPASSSTSPAAPAAPAPRLRRPVRRALAGIGLALTALVAVLLVRAATLTSRQVEVPPVTDLAVDEARIAERLSRALTFETISRQDRQADLAPFTALHAALAEMYPRAHAALPREIVAGGSLLYTWRGLDPGKFPVLLMGHLDVVPVEPGTEAAWQKPPYSGAIEGGFVWGRGALDCKGPVVAMLEAAELLIAQGFTPARTVYLAFGHDEEIGGHAGARAIAEKLRASGVRLEYVIDEGLFITEGITPGVSAPVALVGVAEKGYVTVELAVDGQGGHSSIPPRPTPAGILARAIGRLEDRPLPAHLEGPASLMLDTLGPEMGFATRLGVANRWLLAPVLVDQLSRAPATDALLRTTTAPTMLEGSVKENVLPKRVRAIVNFRVHPADTVERVLAHVRATVDDARVSMRALPETRSEPSPVSPTDAPGYRSIERTLRGVFPGTVVAPSLMLGGTDTKHYLPLSANVYRFSPLRVRAEDLGRFHGTSERIATKDLAQAARFYAQLVRDTGAL